MKKPISRSTKKMRTSGDGVRPAFLPFFVVVARSLSAAPNQPYCRCGSIERGIRSATESVESAYRATCDVCPGTAEIACAMAQNVVIAPGQIRKASDQRCGRGS